MRNCSVFWKKNILVKNFIEQEHNCYLVLTELLVGLDPFPFAPSMDCLDEDLKIVK